MVLSSFRNKNKTPLSYEDASERGCADWHILFLMHIVEYPQVFLNIA
jgi:hypothetical protein